MSRKKKNKRPYQESEDLALRSASALVTLDLTSVSFGFFIYEMRIIINNLQGSCSY